MEYSSHSLLSFQNDQIINFNFFNFPVLVLSFFFFNYLAKVFEELPKRTVFRPLLGNVEKGIFIAVWTVPG